ncbi:hypothetical protein GCM10010409_55020 [Mycolicibacterium diernhoferi]
MDNVVTEASIIGATTINVGETTGHFARVFTHRRLRATISTVPAAEGRFRSAAVTVIAPRSPITARAQAMAATRSPRSAANCADQLPQSC